MKIELRPTIISGAIFLLSTVIIAKDYTAILRSYRPTEEARVSVGMSTDQVKEKLGAPTAVESGFPKIDASQIILNDEPKMVGQLNNSTWFYFSAASAIRFKEDIFAQMKYQINNIETTQQLYDRYDGREKVYILDGKIVDPVMGEGYLLTKAKNLQIQVIDTNENITCAKPPKESVGKVIGYTTTIYLPVLSVIFDRGTRVVAATRAYYLYVSTTTEMLKAEETDKPK